MGCARRTLAWMAGESPVKGRCNEPLLPSSRASGSARDQVKRRQRCVWAGLMSTERFVTRSAEVFPYAEGNTGCPIS